MATEDVINVNTGTITTVTTETQKSNKKNLLAYANVQETTIFQISPEISKIAAEVNTFSLNANKMDDINYQGLISSTSFLFRTGNNIPRLESEIRSTDNQKNVELP